MTRYHSLEELAPRDIVARAIVTEMSRTRTPHVLLDLVHLGAAFLQQRFPRIYETCLRYGIDIGRQPVPVRPAAHYAMGGVRTDLDGRASVARLFAAGEVACTGVHGANRLASNSLLEGVVFGARAGRAMRETPSMPVAGCPPAFTAPTGPAEEFRRLAWEHCGIVRCADGLGSAIAQLRHFEQEQPAVLTPEASEARNIRQVVLIIASCAAAREESRGAHYRSDFPHHRPEFEKHSVIRKDAGIRFE
jgi:L-aspartate oxidase